MNESQITNWISSPQFFYNDVGSDFDATNGVFTVGTGQDGKYIIEVSVQWNTNLNGIRTIRIYTNGSVSGGSVHNNDASAASGSTTRLSDIYDLAEGDTVEVRVFQDSGSSVDVLQGFTTWGMERLR